uniref:Multiple epidermal growth factor-like domains protein 10 isoform X2 n=1 Tax=Crassostrea virginica TaxID=6565 RepID=A0A8B8AW45_CRAVI|nr:multiple epidermal growth factor-like domains protein 10 isoform X2 [Crassostrea virginica]
MAGGCSYSQFWDGTQCTACLDGFYGKHCTKKCEDGAYGQQCGNTCQCPIEQCNHVSGCITASLPTNIMNTSNVIITYENAYSTTSQHFEGPVVTPSNNPFSLNLQITAIGGIIALLLLALTIISFVKLQIKRKQRANQISIKTESNQEEDLYQTVHLDGNETNENQQHRKYYQLKHSVSHEPNRHRENYAHYQEIDETHNLSNDSDSSNINVISDTSEQHNYLDVLGSSSSKDSAFNDENLANHDQDLSPQYTDTVPNGKSGAKENRYNNGSEYASNDTYLDVTNEPIV